MILAALMGNGRRAESVAAAGVSGARVVGAGDASSAPSSLSAPAPGPAFSGIEAVLWRPRVTIDQTPNSEFEKRLLQSQDTQSLVMNPPSALMLRQLAFPQLLV